MYLKFLLIDHDPNGNHSLAFGCLACRLAVEDETGGIYDPWGAWTDDDFVCDHCGKPVSQHDDREEDEGDAPA